MKPIVIGIGEYLWDVLPTGKKAGGAPVNFAYHASQHGTEGWAISAVGKDELGDELLEVTAAHKINMEVSRVDYPTGTVQVTLCNGQPNYEICEGVAWDYIPLTEESINLAKQAKAISFGTLAQRNEVSRETTRVLVQAAPEDALKVYDINLRQHFWSKELIEASLGMANVFKINDEELETLKPVFGLEGMDTDQACRCFIEKFSLKMLVLTAGDKFSSIYYGNEKSTIETPRVEVVDAVGAGDAFSGSLIGSLLTGKSIKEAHKEAVETAAYVCTQVGAWTPAR